jgi:hypothetical protein
MDTSFSPGHSSAEEVEDEPSMMQIDSWQRKQSHDAQETSPSIDSSAASSSQLPKFPLPMQNAGASQGLAMNADGKRSSAMGSSRAHIAPSTATVSVTYKRFAFGKSGFESADPA